MMETLDDDIPDWLKPKRNKHICLPQALLEELRSDPDLGFAQSMVHTLDEMDLGTRDTLIKCYVLGRGDQLLHLGDSWDEDEGEWSLKRQFYPGSNSTYLHFAARLADVPLVYECIRLGVDVNSRDVKGQTPLHFVAQEVIRFHHDLVKRKREKLEITAQLAHMKKLRRIAQILLEQGADCCITPSNGFSPVYLAWYALDLELTALFALYGASEITSFPTDATKRRPANAPLWVANPDKIGTFKRLIDRLSKDGLPTRPPRRCPCLSGKPLSECHESGYHLWPSGFACICGSAKTYARCCKRRNFEILEKWDHERRRLTVLRRVDEGNEVVYANPFSAYDAIVALSNGDEELEKLSERKTKQVLDAIEYNDTGSEEKADPAFRYVLQKRPALPTPMDRLYTKALLKMLSDNWNAEVDEYIASGVDKRSTLMIEQAAKLDPDFGPLWKRCEAPGCSVAEHPGLKMKSCSACKRIYYCSTTCQKSDWKAHKSACKRRDHPPQALRSQEIYRHILKEIIEPLDRLDDVVRDLNLTDDELAELLADPNTG